jgi:hypothetical protein
MGIDEALKKRRKQNAIDERKITHRAILEPEIERVTPRNKPQSLQNRKEGTNVIRKPSQR